MELRITVRICWLDVRISIPSCFQMNKSSPNELLKNDSEENQFECVCSESRKEMY